MTSEFEKYNEYSDKELIELTMSVGIDREKANAILDFRKHEAQKRQNRLSTIIAMLMSLFAFIQVIIAITNYASGARVSTYKGAADGVSADQGPITTPAITPTFSSIPGALGSITRTLHISTVMASTAVNTSGIFILVPQGISVNLISCNFRPGTWGDMIPLSAKTSNSFLIISRTLPLELVGETCGP